MPGDYSRFTDDPRKRFSKLWMQQGKVQLDADWNELADIVARGERLQAVDTFGFKAVPRITTPDGFLISAVSRLRPLPSDTAVEAVTTAVASALRTDTSVDRFGSVFFTDLKIGAGRCYIDGLRAEAFDGETLFYSEQPFFRSPPSPPPISGMPAGKGLVYLDVWEREITYIEDPSLLEPALAGVDTSTRWKTIWQVRIAPGLNCDSDLRAEFPPSTTRMSVSVTEPAEEPDPCKLPESGGFQDVENRHYRVEIISATQFLFARDPVVSEIEEISAGSGNTSILRVARIGRDAVLAFADGNTVEVTNERIVLNGEPRIFAHITGIDPGTNEITIEPKVSASEAGPGLRARLIRWDSDPIGITPGTKIPLENGIEVEFTAGTVNVGDYWMFPARAATHGAGPLENALPRGIEHHYCPLAVVTGLGTANPAVERDCRPLWPPPAAGGDCECIACVTPEEHNGGTHTIQMAVNEAGANPLKRGGKVCLKPGTYIVKETIQILNRTDIALCGHGRADLVFAGNDGPVIQVDRSSGTTIEGLRILRATFSASNRDGAAILIRNCVVRTRVQDCAIVMTDPPPPPPPGPASTATAVTPVNTARIGTTSTVNAVPAFPRGIAIALEGLINDLHIVRNQIASGTGVGILPGLLARFKGTNPLLVARAVEIAGNVFECRACAVAIEALGVSAAIRGNLMLGSMLSAIILGGTAEPGRQIVIEENEIQTPGAGITFSTDRTTVAGNLITSDFTPPILPPFNIFLPGFDVLQNARFDVRGTVFPPASLLAANPEQSGILAAHPAVDRRIAAAEIVGNRVSGMHGHGIFIDLGVDGLMVKQNFVASTAGTGILVSDRAAGTTTSIENNDLRAVATGDAAADIRAGIRVGPLCVAEVASNAIAGVGPEPAIVLAARACAGILLEGVHSADVHDNCISGVNATAGDELSAGIEVLSFVGDVQISGNIVESPPLSNFPGAHCYPLRVGPRPRRSMGFNIVLVSAQRFVADNPVTPTNPTNPVTGPIGPGPINTFGSASTDAAQVTRSIAAEAIFTSGIAVTQVLDRFFFNGFLVQPVPIVTSTLSIRGNQFRCVPPFNSRLGLVVVNDEAALCTFAENICRSDSLLNEAVVLRASTVAADANQIVAGSEVSLTVTTLNLDRWTILGNIVSGTILANGRDIHGTAYEPLNRRI
jgi:hypothetical protein